MKENPFVSPETTADPVAVDQPKTLSGRGFEIAHNVFRGLLAFFFIGYVPVFIVPGFKDMFEEFGVQLSLVLQYVVHFSNLAVSLSLAFLPLCILVFTSIEFGLFNLPSSRSKTLINVVYWLILILIVGLACYSTGLTILSITPGLTGP